MNKLQIFKASAGSGKTYLLTESYLKLAFERSDSFSKILAVTFTNKAAGEMKDRILSELNNVISKGKRAEHYSSISDYLQSDSENFIIQRAKSVRDALLHNYSMFYVGTIDSFVQKVVRSFAYEMNLNSTFEIELDKNKVITDLTEKLYEQSSENKELREWLINYVEHKINEGKTWDFRSEVKSLAEEIFKENFQSLYIKKGTFEQERENIQKFKETLYSIKSNFENRMTEISKQYAFIIENAGIDLKKFGRNFQTISNLFLKSLPEKKYDDIKVTIINALEGPENWYSKSTADDIKTIVLSLYPELSECLVNFFRLIKSDSGAYYTSEAILQNFYSFGILNDIAELVPEYRSKNNVLLISDTNFLLKEIIGNNDAPFIYEKFGNRFNTILIDEFQDTSGFQWANFKPLIENSLSMGFYNMIVGDIKQSIYRWRNGDWKLLHEQVQKDIGEHFAEEKTLDMNWRSRENIVKFNNQIFRDLPQKLQIQFNEEIFAVTDEVLKKKLISDGYTEIIQKAYRNQEQTVPETSEKKGGSVNLYFTGKSTNSDYNKKLFEVLPQTINDILMSDQVNASEIGILVRKNSEAKNIADILLKYQNENTDTIHYQIISPESLYIGNSSSVRILVSAMKHLHNSEDDVNTAELIFEYQQFTGTQKEKSNDLFLSVEKKEFESFLPELFLKQADILKRTSLYELSERLIDIFGLSESKSDFLYLKAFQNIISEQINKQNNNISDFLDWWNEKGKEKSVKFSEETDAVRIMTIHSSKGLAFKYVFIPYADMNIDHGQNAPLLWVKSNIKPFNALHFFPVKYSSKLILSYFAEAYLNEKLYANIDNLNLLYVALTRAKDELHLFSSYPKTKKDRFSSIGHMLHEFVILSKKEQESKESVKFAQKEAGAFSMYSFSENHSIPAKSEDEKADIVNLLFEPDIYPNSVFEDRININFSTEDFFAESIEEIEHKVNFGILMHQIFGLIQYPEDVGSALDLMISEGYISENERKELKNEIHEIITRQSVKEWFSKEYKVITEEALINSEGDIRIPDRVILNDEKIIVIDFKFGKKHKKYIDQISEYKKLIQDIYKQDTEAYIYYVLDDISEKV